MTKHDFFIQFFFSSIAKQATFAYVNYAPIDSWNQPVLSDEGKVSCSRKQRSQTRFSLRYAALEFVLKFKEIISISNSRYAS